MTFNYSKLRGKIVEKYGNMCNFSNAVGITPGYFATTLKRGGAFRQDAIYRMAHALDIEDQIGDYFFTVDVQELEQEANG